MNPSFFHPKAAVRAAFEQPNIPLAIILVFLAGLGNLLTALLVGIPLNYASLAVNSEILAFIRLAFFVLVIILLSLILRRKPGNVPGVISALSLTFLVNLVATILFGILQLLLVPREVFSTIVSGLSSGTSAVELIGVVQRIPGIEGLAAFLALVTVLGLATLAFNFLLLFFTLRVQLHVSRIATLFIALFIALLTLFVPFV